MRNDGVYGRSFIELSLWPVFGAVLLFHGSLFCINAWLIVVKHVNLLLFPLSINVIALIYLLLPVGRILGPRWFNEVLRRPYIRGELGIAPYRHHTLMEQYLRGLDGVTWAEVSEYPRHGFTVWLRNDAAATAFMLIHHDELKLIRSDDQ